MYTMDRSTQTSATITGTTGARRDGEKTEKNMSPLQYESLKCMHGNTIVVLPTLMDMHVVKLFVTASTYSNTQVC